MQIIQFIPGAVAPPATITIPTEAPDIDALVGVEIVRLPGALANHLPAAIIAAIDDHAAVDVAGCVDDHPQGDIVNALDDHPVHAHPFVSQGLGVAPAQVLGMPVGLNAIEDDGAAALHTVAAAAATGVIDNLVAQGHAVGVNPVGHVAVALAVAGHAATLLPVVHAGANPVIAVTATRATARTILLSDPTLVGDMLTLAYLEVGGRVPVS